MGALHFYASAVRALQLLHAPAAPQTTPRGVQEMIAFKRSAAAIAEIDRRIEVLRDAQRGAHSLGLQECLREELEALAERRDDELRWGRRLARFVGLVPAQGVRQ